MNNQKGFSPIIILIIIVLLGGGIFAWQYFSGSEEQAEKEGPYIEVLTPNGGEKLVVGEEYVIRWRTENLPSNAKILIRIKRDDGGIIGIINNILPQQDESKSIYIWQIDLNKLLCWSWGAGCIELNPDEVLKHEFKIEAVAYWPNPEDSRYNVTIMDGSDNYFSIIEDENESVFSVDTWICLQDKQPPPFIDKKLSPEETVFRSLEWYMGYLGYPDREKSYYKNPYFSDDYKEKLRKIWEQEVVLADPVLFVQDLPSSFKIHEATITDDSTYLIITLDYGRYGYPQRKAFLVLINDRWRVNELTVLD
jgi:hypothetical protein